MRLDWLIAGAKHRQAKTTTAAVKRQAFGHRLSGIKYVT